MKITLLGASGGEVTGSAFLVQSGKSQVVVDCGMFQGGRKNALRNQRLAPGRAETLNAVVVTHAHLDHVGRLPLLPQAGFRGPIYATDATIEMASLILRDSVRIMAQDNERQNEKRLRAGDEPQEPLFTEDDTEAAIKQFKGVPYQQKVRITPNIEAIWSEAGHMLGSASVQLIVNEDGREKKVVFTGDLGPRGLSLTRNYQPFDSCDMVFLESTYGGRDHRPFRETVDEFVKIVQETAETGGKIFIPTFAVGRAQLLIVLLAWMFRTKKVNPFPVYLDSPMAIEATVIYEKYEDLYSDELKDFIRERPIREDMQLLKMAATPDESKAINQVAGTCLVMAGAGMCNAGRILHHLKQNLWKPQTHVVIVGYQSRGTLGRKLVDREESVMIYGQKIAVRAEVHTLGGFSAHAGQTDLLHWMSRLASCKPKVAVIHGENSNRRALADKIRSQFKLTPLVPRLGETIEL